MTQLGKYELHELIGKGGFGTVYRATDTSLGRQVALKILHPQLAADSEFIERFRKEASLAAALENPHILVVHEIGEESGRFFIAMRYYSGSSLAVRLKQGALGWDETCKIIVQICEGLQELHERGWIHRDLKPGNILFDAAGRAVIADFGLARALNASGSSTSTGLGGGTPFYKAPELWRGKPPASSATDVYALGCILGEMLTGQQLFPGETPDEVMTRHILDGPEFGTGWPPPDVPQEAKALVETALARDPAHRPSNASSFASALAVIRRQTGSQSWVVDKKARQDEEERPNQEVVERKSIEAEKKAKAEANARALKGAEEMTRKEEEDLARLRTEQRGRDKAQDQAAHQSAVHTEQSTTWNKRENKPPASGFPWKWIGLSLAVLLMLSILVNVLIPKAQPTPTAAPTLRFESTIKPEPTRTLLPDVPIITATLAPTATGTPTQIIVQTQVPEKDDMPLIFVPAGDFLMGSNGSDTDVAANEQPQHTVTLNSFWIDKYEVSNRQFEMFVSATGYKTDAEKMGSSIASDGTTWNDTAGAYWRKPGGPGTDLNGKMDQPVVAVSWNDAKVYCEWAARRLPTEAEWEKARGRGTQFGYVGYAYGALGMSNDYEWVSDWYDSVYYRNSPESNPQGPSLGAFHVLRGGYSNNGTIRHSGHRDGLPPSYRDEFLSFRCAR